MPSDLAIGAFVLGAVLLLISLLSGGFKIFGAEVSGTTGGGRKLLAFVAGLVFIVIGLSTERPDRANKAPEAGSPTQNGDGKPPVATTSPEPETPAQAAERELRVAAAQMSAQMPIMWGDNLRVDSAVVGPGLRITYTVTTLLGKGSDAAGTARPQTIQNLKRAVCADPALRFLLSSGVAVTYNLRGTDLVQIVSLDVTPSDCQ